LEMNPEGAIVLVDTNYVAPGTGAFRLALRGVSRNLEILSAGFTSAHQTTNKFYLLNSSIGDNYFYGFDYSTNGLEWHEYAATNFWGQPQTWFDYHEIEMWMDNTPPPPLKFIRLKAKKYR
jgi:hypothetical protein